MTIWINDEIVGQTSTINDRFNATWDEFIDLTLITGSTLSLELWDIDLSDHDGIFRCELSLTGSSVRTRMATGISCADAVGSLTASLEAL